MENLSDFDEEKLLELLFPAQVGRPASEIRPLPDFSRWHDELKSKGMTIGLLWENYKQNNPDGFNYSYICEQYRHWLKKQDLVMKQYHRAGEKLFSDFAGSKLSYTDPHTGEVITCHLFVAALGASSYTYAEAFANESSESWCNGHANAFAFFAGCSELIIPDNAKGVVTKPSIYEPDLNPDFQHMAEFFGAAVIPARVKRPRDKATVEAAVRVATMWIIAALRHRTFFSLFELNAEIKILLDKLNNRPFKKSPGSRKILFEQVERRALKPLPEGKYEYTEIGYAKVGQGYHIDIEGFCYSVPYQYTGQKVEYRLNSRTLEVFLQGRRIASHARLWIKDKPRTCMEHMPDNHRHYQEQFVDWTPSKLAASAKTIGESVYQAVVNILKKHQHPEQKHRSCIGVLRLARTWGNEKLNLACKRSIELNACSYKHIKLILENAGYARPLAANLQLARAESHENVRGPQYYNQNTNEENENANSPNIGESAPNETEWHDSRTGDPTTDPRRAGTAL